LGQPPSPRGLPAHLARALLAGAVLAPSSEGASDCRPISQALLARRGGPSPCTRCSPLTSALLSPMPLSGVGSIPTSMCCVQRDPPPPRAPDPPPHCPPHFLPHHHPVASTPLSPPSAPPPDRHAPPHLPVLRSPFPIVVATTASAPITTLRHVGSLSTAVIAWSWGTPSVFVGPAPPSRYARDPIPPCDLRLLVATASGPSLHRHLVGLRPGGLNSTDPVKRPLI
jgi:hypothetical protein